MGVTLCLWQLHARSLNKQSLWIDGRKTDLRRKMGKFRPEDWKGHSNWAWHRAMERLSSQRGLAKQCSAWPDDHSFRLSEMQEGRPQKTDWIYQQSDEQWTRHGLKNHCSIRRELHACHICLSKMRKDVFVKNWCV